MSRDDDAEFAEILQDWLDAHPSWIAPLLSLALPVAAYSFFSLAVGSEADASWELFGVSMIAGVCVGLAAGYYGFGLSTAFASSAWYPALLTWKRVYWAAGMPSPGGTAQSIVRSATGAEVPAWLAMGVLMGLCALPGWGVMRFDRSWTKKHGGRSLFDE